MKEKYFIYLQKKRRRKEEEKEKIWNKKTTEYNYP